MARALALVALVVAAAVACGADASNPVFMGGASPMLTMHAAHAAAAAHPPVFANSWSSDQIQSMVINQGGVMQPDGSTCCPAESPQCKVQTEFQASIVFNWFEGKKQAQKNPDGSGIVTDFAAMKEYAVSASGDCTSYCPIPAGNTIGGGQFIFPNATDMGNVNYGGRTAADWRWFQVFPILNITMQVSDFYVDNSGSSPIPLAEIDQITPFGEKIGQQNMTFVSFTAGVPDAKHFTVNGAATCKMNSQCQGSGGNDDGGGGGGGGRRLLEQHAGASYHLEKYMGVGWTRVVLDE